MMYLIHDLNSGAIDRTVSCDPDLIALQLGAGEAFVEVEADVNSNHFYVLDGIVTPRQNYELDALPLPCTLYIEGVYYQVTEQPEFEFDAPGSYRIEVDAGAAYLKKEFDFDYQP
jgi:hypothetical protein